MTNETSSGPFMARKRVLVVDDLTPVMTAMLRESFDVVGIVSDGQAALESTLKLSPDLVVLAISMPGMSGIEIAQELKRRGNNAKIVFLTVHEDSDILARALAAGGLGYVAKVRMDIDLIPAINEAFADRHIRLPSLVLARDVLLSPRRWFHGRSTVDEGVRAPNLTIATLCLANCYFTRHKACHNVTYLALLNLPPLSFELDVADS
jgi:CheY-like chemotaxis protein